MLARCGFSCTSVSDLPFETFGAGPPPAHLSRPLVSGAPGRFTLHRRLSRWSGRGSTVSGIKLPTIKPLMPAPITECPGERFLMSRLMEDWLDLIGSFEADFRLKTEE